MTDDLEDRQVCHLCVLAVCSTTPAKCFVCCNNICVASGNTMSPHHIGCAMLCCIPPYSQAGELAVLLRQHHLMSHVNLIPWNPVEDAAYKRPSRSRVMAFKQVLEEAGLPVSVRTTRGLEAAAACGQLRNQFQKAAVQEPKSLS